MSKVHFTFGLCFLLVYVLAVCSAWAAPAYPDFEPLGKDAVGVSPESFRRYIRPQIKSIIQEYYSVLAKTGPHQESLINLRRQIFALWVQIDEVRQTLAPHQAPPASSAHLLAELYQKTKQIEFTVLRLWPTLFKAEGPSLTNTYATLLARPLDLIASDAYRLGHTLEKLMAFAPVTTLSDELTNLQQNFVYPMLLQAESILTIELPKELQENFDGVFRGFIYPLEKYLLTEQDRDYLLSRITELNMAWHSFHTKMVSHDYRLPPNSYTTMATIRNRWNSIMKLIVN